MTTALPIALLVLLVVVILLQIRLLTKQTVVDLKGVQQSFESLEKSQERAERTVRDEIGKSREGAADSARQSREELAGTLKATGDTLHQQIGTLNASTDQKLERVRQVMEQKLDTLKVAVEERLRAIQADNARQLDQMRATVDEKLQGTLEKRLGESFKLVGDRLEQVYKGLGEMQTIAIGVGDLKKVLSNVKARGTWGEVQLGAMLEQILSPDQYSKNVATKDGGERIEFAIKLPGRSDDKSEIVWLPIDAKFPIEDYQRLIEAQEKADPEAARDAAKQLEVRVKQSAQDICNKYIGPPKTTDFGILYLPIEGLFAEVIRCIGLPETIQRECRVVIAGPTTLWSLLNSLQIGFRTLAIEKRSSEVWKVLGAVKAEFGKFGELLDGVKRKLDQAADTIDNAARKSKTIQRRLRDVQELPAAEAQSLLMLDHGSPADGIGEAEP